MGLPVNAYPIGKYSTDEQKANNPLPPYICTGCGGRGDGYELLGVDEVDTLWCPACGSTCSCAFGRCSANQ